MPPELIWNLLELIDIFKEEIWVIETL